MDRTYPAGLMLVTRLDELVELSEHLGGGYVRFSAGPDADADGSSADGESGLALPGLSVTGLRPEPWWQRPARQWVARRLRQYAHLSGGERYAWVLTGQVCGRGPDDEPLVCDVHPVAVVDDAVLDEAARVYAETFQPGRLPDKNG